MVGVGSIALTDEADWIRIPPMSKQRPRPIVAMPARPAVTATGYWRRRIFKNSYTYRGQRAAVKGWSVKIQHRRVRRTFSLAATSRAAAAIEAKAIYQTIITQGWDAIAPPGQRRFSTARPGAGDGPEPLPKTDVQYWRRRLLRRRHRLPPSAASPAGICARIEHAGINHYFPLGTLDQDSAAAKAREIYLAVVKEGWGAVNQRFSRELTVAIHWAENPLAWTYATVHTVVEGTLARAGSRSTNIAQPVKVAIMEPEAGVRRALARCVNGQSGFACTATYGSAKDALREIPRKAPNLALVNGTSPDVAAGEFLNNLRHLVPGFPVIFFTTHEDSDQLFKATPGGASGYLLKRTSPERLFEPIVGTLEDGALSIDRVALHVRRYFQNLVQSLSALESAREMAKLTPREHDILNFLSKGYLDKEIAHALGISLWTVHGHLKKIYDKLGVHTRTEAAVRYLHK